MRIHPDIERLRRASRCHVIPFDGCDVACYEWGEGAPLVLLHGGYGSWLHWLRNIDELARHYRVIAFDSPSHGESGDAPDDWDARWMGEALAHSLKAVVGNTEPVRGIGFSMGGILLGWMGVALQDQLTHLVLAGPNGMSLAYPPLPKLMSMRAFGSAPTPAQVASVHRWNLAALMLSGPSAVDDLAVDVQTRNIALCRVNSDHIPASNTLNDALKHVPGRLVGVWGEHDAFVGPHMALRSKHLRSFDDRLTFHVIDGAGHWAMYENPRLFNQIVLDELDI
ncbi:MAG: alpha/beta hydrolase [Chromatiales bacterium]|nr:alpha/beta hydrolase [Chromatiales bacterium]